jgi:NDP-sugar pyrophosphorylase family protein
VKDNFYSNVVALRRYGDVIPSTLILYKGKIINSEFEIKHGDVTKGKTKVFYDGEELSGASIIYESAVLFDDNIHIGEGTVIEPGAFINGPTVIGNNTEVRQGAYIRGSCIIGNRCVVGHTTEMKNSIMLDDAKAGHFAYLGDSILGNHVNLGAGTKLANLKLSGSEVVLKINGNSYNTGLRKLGAILGDYVQIGCNSVTNPGALVAKSSHINPLTNVPSGLSNYSKD